MTRLPAPTFFLLAFVIGGYSNKQGFGDAVESLRAGPDFLDELEIIEAASKGWRNPLPVDDQSLDARQILKRTYQVYRASKSYIDTGLVQTEYKNASREWTGETRFKTAWVGLSDDGREEQLSNSPGL